MKKEIILNLWAYCDAQTKLIHALSAKNYELGGTDEEKLQYLDAKRETGFKQLKKYSIPAQHEYSVNDSLVKGVMHIDILNTAPLAILEDIIKSIEKRIAPKKVNKSPLYVLTLLHVNQDQTIKAIITQSDSDWFNQQTIDTYDYTKDPLYIDF